MKARGPLQAKRCGQVAISLAASASLLGAFSVAVRGADATAWTVFETSFTTTKVYGNPFTDLNVDVEFTDGKNRWIVPAFWAGGGTWKVRFAPPAAGEYAYRVRATDTENADLNGEEHQLLVRRPASDNPLLRHGFLRISADARHFEHADGTPFLWLGDTWWKCLSKRMTLEDFRVLATDRAAKGFNVVQIVCGPYPDEKMFEPGWENEAGMPYADMAFTQVNPRYFDSADERLAHLVSQGIVPAIVGGWGRPQQGGRSTLEQVGIEGFERHWRHIVARYGALPVVWIVGGEAKDSYGPWSAVARFVKKIDPYGHPLCYHAPGDPRTVIADNDVFDFDMVAIGHAGFDTAAQSLALMRSCFDRTPRRPGLCGEACYERHMQTNFDDVQRHLFWSFMLSGAAGHTYGAAGVWQASVEGDPGIDPVYDLTTWREGMVFPGAIQVGSGKRLLETYPWWRFEPRRDWTEEDCFAAGIPGEVRFIYRPKRRIYDWKGPLVKRLEPDVPYRASYVDPVRGTRFQLGSVASAEGEYAAPRLPSPQDWVLILERE
jgi:hypothetical protein